MKLNKLYGTRINNAKTRKIKRIYSLVDRNHFESFLEISLSRWEKLYGDLVIAIKNTKRQYLNKLFFRQVHRWAGT